MHLTAVRVIDADSEGVLTVSQMLQTRRNRGENARRGGPIGLRTAAVIYGPELSPPGWFRSIATGAIPADPWNYSSQHLEHLKAGKTENRTLTGLND
jgi:hypothetical protein